MTTPEQKPPTDTRAYVLTKSDIANTPETKHVHQFNEHAIRHTVSLSDIVGLTKFGLHLVRVEAGDETTTHHYHEESDEFIYVLSGELSLRFGDEQYQLRLATLWASLRMARRTRCVMIAMPMPLT